MHCQQQTGGIATAGDCDENMDGFAKIFDEGPSRSERRNRLFVQNADINRHEKTAAMAGARSAAQPLLFAGNLVQHSL
jgi:hypothetical protein